MTLGLASAELTCRRERRPSTSHHETSRACASLDRDEYIEQAYFFRVYRERVEENQPAQEVLATARDELLATTRLPMAIDFLSGEMQLHGRIGEGMAKLGHYFSPFQAYIMQRAEADTGRFETRMALRILEAEAEYRADEVSPQALFMYQFECLARNHLGYDQGLRAIAADGKYNEDWRTWIDGLRRSLGVTDFARLVYGRSQHRADELRRQGAADQDLQQLPKPLFGSQEGRIAKAHYDKDPLYLFAALQRHLGYPRVPRVATRANRPTFDPQVEMRFQRLESRLALLESEAKGGIDLSEFYAKEGRRELDQNAD
ncbi:MAG: hypothetical protein R3B90_22395 [Planctomycetaceae bacterium]